MTDCPVPLGIVAARLSAAGLTARYYRVNDGGYLVVHPAHDLREAEMLIDTDGYTALHYRMDLAVDPSRVADAVIAALDAVKGVGPRTPHQHAKSVARYDDSTTECVGDSGMPGPQDQVPGAEPPMREAIRPDTRPMRETDAPQESQASGTLHERLERLPPNHPSSPFREDGSRKPPPPDLRNAGLPLPDETGGDAARPDRSSGLADLPRSDERASANTDHAHAEADGRDKPRVGPDGSWDWKGHHLTPDQSRTGDQAAERCRSAEGRDADGKYGEHGLTPAMRRIEAELEHGRLVDRTEDFALKSPDRFKEKLAKEIIRQPDKSAEEIAGEIHDGIRYTFVFDSDNYRDGVWEAHNELESAGYRLDVRRNSWSSPEYKGINSRWHDSASNMPFEVQFHTHDSWKVKQETHHAYERIADPRTPADEIKRLRAYQKEMSGSLEVPRGATEIPDYRREGR